MHSCCETSGKPAGRVSLHYVIIVEQLSSMVNYLLFENTTKVLTKSILKRYISKFNSYILLIIGA